MHFFCDMKWSLYSSFTVHSLLAPLVFSSCSISSAYSLRWKWSQGLPHSISGSKTPWLNVSKQWMNRKRIGFLTDYIVITPKRLQNVQWKCFNSGWKPLVARWILTLWHPGGWMTFFGVFWFELRTKQNKRYKSASMLNIRHGINRYLQETRPDMDIVKDPEFKTSNKHFKAISKDLKRSGKGDIDHHNPVTDTDLKKCYEYFASAFDSNTTTAEGILWCGAPSHTQGQIKHPDPHCRPLQSDGRLIWSQVCSLSSFPRCRYSILRKH